MQIDVVEKANKIIKLIEENKKAVEFLQKYDENTGMTLYAEASHTWGGYSFKEDVHLEPWEVRLMIHNKQQRIQALEKQLEEL